MSCRIIGHRGARGLFPENTAEGFDAAAALGVTCFELDVAVTRDRVAVVHHDPALHPDIARGPDGAWIDPASRPLIQHLGLEDVQRYDVGRLRPGSATAAQFPQQAAHDGARVPVLRDVLARPGRTFLIELKTFPDRPHLTPGLTEVAACVLDAADAAGVTESSTFLGFDWRVLRLLRRQRPGLRLAWSTHPGTLARASAWLGRSEPFSVEAVPAAILDEGGGSWAPEHAALTPALVEAAHAAGIPVLPWTVNDPGRMQALLHMGVDGIITDYPNRLRQVIDAS